MSGTRRRAPTAGTMNTATGDCTRYVRLRCSREVCSPASSYRFFLMQSNLIESGKGTRPLPSPEPHLYPPPPAIIPPKRRWEPRLTYAHPDSCMFCGG